MFNAIRVYLTLKTVQKAGRKVNTRKIIGRTKNPEDSKINSMSSTMKRYMKHRWTSTSCLATSKENLFKIEVE